MKPNVPDPTTVVLIMTILCMGLVLWLHVWAFCSLVGSRNEQVCDTDCWPRDGYVVEGRCYCENEGLSLVPIEEMIPDTGVWQRDSD